MAGPKNVFFQEIMTLNDARIVSKEDKTSTRVKKNSSIFQEERWINEKKRDKEKRVDKRRKSEKLENEKV